ncbi:MAG TPA: alpha/beta fold hydrolase [Acidobacteriaceae bacterium]
MSRRRSGARPGSRSDRARALRNVLIEEPKDPAALSWKTYGYAVLAMLVLFLLGALVVWQQPLEVLGALTRARLAYNGFHNEYTTIRGNRIHYYEGGSGAPVVLVHGLGSRAEDWANLMPQLKQAGFHVYAIDLLGYGRSAQPANAAYSIAEEAHYVEDFIAQRGLEKVDLVGWSMGGWVTMRVALDQPQRIGRLVLCNAAGIRFVPSFTIFDFEPTTIPAVQHLYRLLMPQPTALPNFLARDMVSKFQRLNWVVDRSARSMFHGDDLLDGKLGGLQMPTLIIWGKQDHLIPLATGISLHEQIPHSVLEIYDGCGHLAPGQCASRIGPRMVDFFQGKEPQMQKTAEFGPD